MRGRLPIDRDAELEKQHSYNRDAELEKQHSYNRDAELEKQHPYNREPEGFMSAEALRKPSRRKVPD